MGSNSTGTTSMPCGLQDLGGVLDALEVGAVAGADDERRLVEQPAVAALDGAPRHATGDVDAELRQGRDGELLVAPARLVAVLADQHPGRRVDAEVARVDLPGVVGVRLLPGELDAGLLEGPRQTLVHRVRRHAGRRPRRPGPCGGRSPRSRARGSRSGGQSRSLRTRSAGVVLAQLFAARPRLVSHGGASSPHGERHDGLLAVHAVLGLVVDHGVRTVDDRRRSPHSRGRRAGSACRDSRAS